MILFGIFCPITPLVELFFEAYSAIRNRGILFLFEPDGATSLASGVLISGIGAFGAVFAAIAAANVTSKNARADAQMQVAEAASLAQKQLAHAEERFSREQEHARRLARQPLVNEAVVEVIKITHELRTADFSSEPAAHFNESWIYSCNLVEINLFESETVRHLEYVRALFGGIISYFWEHVNIHDQVLLQIDALRDSNPATKGTRDILTDQGTRYWANREDLDRAAAMNFFRATQNIRRTFSTIAREWPDEDSATAQLRTLSENLKGIQDEFRKSEKELESMVFELNGQIDVQTSDN